MPVRFRNNVSTILLCAFLAIGLMTFYGCGGGGDSSSDSSADSSTTDDTTDDTTDGTYDEDGLPDGTSFSIGDTEYDLSSATLITLNGSSITVSGSGAKASGGVVTIAAAGTYNITGDLTDGRIIVNTADTGDVILYFNGVDITCSDSSPVDIESAERVIIYLADATDNILADEDSSSSYDSDGEAIDAALYSKEDLVIYGSGTLTINADYLDGIKSKDGLVIAEGSINVISNDDGIIGKNYISIEGGDITVNAGGDGLKSTNDGDTTQGYIYVGAGAGEINITAGADGIQVETNIVINGGIFTITTAGGSSNYSSLGTDATAKGLKAPVGITIYDGKFTINSADDAIHSNDTILIEGGDFDLASGDDAIHSDLAVTINDGTIDISTCYEGVEGAAITINGGEIHVLSTDDAINVAGGNDSSGTIGGRGSTSGDTFTTPNSGYTLTLNGGYIAVNSGELDGAGGDGVDVNGSVTMSGGTLIVNGPYPGYDGNGAFDVDGTFTITGGFVIGAGTSGMAVAPQSSSSTQNSKLITLASTQTAGKLFHIETSSGADIVTFAPANQYQAITFSSPDLDSGTYYVYTGGSSTGTATDGLYDGGTYSGGTQVSAATFTIN